MTPMRLRPGLSFWASVCLALACAIWPAALRAQEPATAAFAPSATSVGQQVQLRVEVKGTTAMDQHPEIHLDGLDIRFVGPNLSVDLSSNDSRVVYIYQVTPQRAGVYTLPALTFDLQGHRYHTEPAVLHVQNGPVANSDDAEALDPVGHAEIVLGKKSVYVGEPVSAEIHLMVDARIRIQPENMPDLEGDGFTKEKFLQPRMDRTHRDGREYNIVTFHTTVTPSRAGAISIGPSTLHYLSQSPRARAARRSPFGNGLFDDFFNDPMLGFIRPEQKEIEAPSVNLEVKPLPSAGRPANFNGAVGQYRLAVEGNPKVVKIGDPITVKLIVSGSGSLDRIGAPALTDSDGWRTYPPSSRIMADDASGMKGSKIFEQAVIPTAKQSHLPIYEFSYFDPRTEKYVTVKSDAVPIHVEGAPLPAPAPVAKAEEQPSSPPKPAAPLPAPTDITGIRYEFGDSRSVDPLYLHLGFLLAQLVPAFGLGGLVIARYWRPNLEGQRVSSLRRESATLRARLRKETGKSAFYAAAVRLFQLQGAIATGRPPETIDAPTVRRLFSANGSTILDEIFETQAASLYAGAAGGDEPISPTERERLLAAITELEKSKPLS